MNESRIAVLASRIFRSGIAGAAGVLFLAAAASGAPGQAPAGAGGAVPTEVVVRVQARNALFVTTDMGAKVVISDADTGEVLARGVTTGTVANADPRLRAGFRTTLDLTGPRRLRVTARAPLSYPHAQAEVSSTQWVMPGRHLRGEGWVLEVPGFVVTLEDVPQAVSVAAGQGSLPLRARVVMMCGCPTEPGGRWDASGYEIRARLHRDGRLLGEYVLTYAGESSTYEASLPVGSPGDHELLVFAYDPETGNTGVARGQFTAVD